MNKTHLLLALIITTLFYASSCTSPKSLYQSEQYNASIDLAIKKIRKRLPKPPKDKHVIILEQAYNESVNKDMARIEFLKKENNDNNWVEIFDLYNSIKYKQNRVQPLLPLEIKSEYRNVDIRIIDVDAEMIKSKKNAGEYLFARGNEMLEKGDKLSAREAFASFSKLKSFDPTFNSNLDRLITQAELAGKNHVVLKFKNDSRMLIPESFALELMRVDLASLNTNWLELDTKEDPSKTYDYIIYSHVEDINIGAEKIKEVRRVETREIEDGWEYVLDNKGNVMRDTAGNDIKRTVYKRIEAEIVETTQTKEGFVRGSFDYFNVGTGQMIQSFSFKKDLIFDHLSVDALGNVNALADQTRKTLNGPPLAFPTGEQMVLDGANLIKEDLRHSINLNLNLIEN